MADISIVADKGIEIANLRADSYVIYGEWITILDDDGKACGTCGPPSAMARINVSRSGRPPTLH